MTLNLTHPYSELLEDLNSAQREAVLSNGHHIRVLAGAGSGKTRVLVSRIAWLLHADQLSAHQFLAVTFTNKASREMRSRLETILGQSLATMWVGTFHNLAHRLLRQHWESAGLVQNFQILDSDDQHRLIKRLIRSLGLDENRFQPKQVQWFINQKKDEGLRAHQILEAQNPHQRTLIQVYQHYETACQQDGVIDFSELLLRSYILLQTNPEILNDYHQRFRHVLVDEFQDTNHIQYDWIKQLTGPQSYLTIVGDDDQSIYGWRGARIENIHRFIQDFPNSQTLSLEQNYRSTEVILSAANALIANNSERFGKNLWTDGAKGEPISVYAAFNEMDEARFIVERIRLLGDEGFSPKEMSILYRSNAQSRVLEEALVHARIPYRVYGGLRYFDRAEIKDALAYLRLICYSEDDTAFERIINTPSRGIGEKTLEILRNTARAQEISLWQSAHYNLEQSAFSTRAAHALSTFLNLIKQLNVESHMRSVGEQVEATLNQSGLIAHYQKEPNERAQARLENLMELVQATQQFVSETPHQQRNTLEVLSEFLNHVVLDAGDYQTIELKEGVQLMTLHAAKGLEFPIVFLTGLEEGLFPSHMSLSEPGRLEEERRLCYVGMTRAMRKLYLSYAESRRYHGNENYRAPSRFLQEIPEQYLQSIKLKTSFRNKPTHYTPSVSKNIPSGSKGLETIANTGFTIGQSIKHPTFGEGILLNYEGEGAYTRLQVKFNRAGTKWLVAQFARLEAI